MYFHVSLYVPSTETDLSEIKSINSKTFPSYFSANSSESMVLRQEKGLIK